METMETIDFSPVAMFRHPMVFCIYCAVVIYVGVSITLGFVLASEYVEDRTFRSIPRRVVLFVLGIVFSIMLVVVLAPYGVALCIWSLFEDTVEEWYRRFMKWRKSRGPQVIIGVRPPRQRNAAGGWEPISDLYALWQSQIPPVYGRHEQDVQVDADVIEGTPNRPPPAYHPRGHREPVSRQ
ncbi:hypothetical protein F4776DRAFT_125988 [Hypoxylon sp. NC0597]|nr:hypothetical protein F4776DRAFT_125988 [Hypoxylon sp. NC0597]